MEPKTLSKSEKIAYGSLAAFLYLIILFYLAHYLWLDEYGGGAGDLNFVTYHMTHYPLELVPFPLARFLSFALIVSLLFAAAFIQLRHRMRFVPGKEEGSAAWNTNVNAYNKEYTEPIGNTSSDITKGDKTEPSKNMIMTQNVFLSMNSRKTGRNNNVLVVGGSGSGKSRFFVKPNILQRNCSYVITDPSGELLETTGKFLEEEGYRVRVFNLVEMDNSNHYNPFHYIRDDNGVNQMINTLIVNTTPEGSSKGDPFWEKSETALLMAICFYLFYEVVPEDQNFGNVMRMVLLGQVQETNERFQSPLDKIFSELEKKDPSHMAVKYYKIFKQAAGKTAKSILISCAVRLSAFNLAAVQELTGTDDIELASIGDSPTAIYVVIPSADTTYNFLVSIMYSQLFETLYFHAENECKGKRLPTPVRFMLDEFANIGTIPDFDKKLATMRKYEISCSIILQNMAQLKTMYKDAWEGIVGNCDSFLFLGSNEQSTTEYVSKFLGKATILGNNYTKSKGQSGSYSTAESFKGRELMTPDEISRMDTANCILIIRGLHPFFDKKYDYPKHPQYGKTGDADDKNLYDYRSRFAERRKEILKKRRDEERSRIKELSSKAKDDKAEKSVPESDAAAAEKERRERMQQYRKSRSADRQSLLNGRDKFQDPANNPRRGRKLDATDSLMDSFDALGYTASEENLGRLISLITDGDFDPQFEYSGADKEVMRRVLAELKSRDASFKSRRKTEEPAEKLDEKVSAAASEEANEGALPDIDEGEEEDDAWGDSGISGFMFPTLGKKAHS